MSLDRWCASRWVKAGSLVLFVLAFAVLHQVAGRYPFWVDFKTYYYGAVLQNTESYTHTDALVRLIDGTSGPHPHNPVWGSVALVGLVFRALTLLPYEVAGVVWQISTAALFLLALIKAGGKRWPLLVAIAAVSPAILFGAHVGNASVLTGALIVYAYGAMRDEQWKRAGIALGLAAAFKLYPAFLLLPLLAGRNWRASLAMVTTTALVLLSALPALGWSSFYDGMTMSLQAGDLHHLWIINSSIPGVIFWMTNGSVATVANYVVTAVVLGGIWWLRRLPAQQLLAVSAAAMLLAQAISWPHYFLLGLLPLTVAFDVIADTRRRLYCVAAYALSVMLPIATATWAAHLAPSLLNAIGLGVLTGLVIHAVLSPSVTSSNHGASPFAAGCTGVKNDQGHDDQTQLRA